MEANTGNTNSYNTSSSQGFYSFKQEEASNGKKRLTLRTAVCTQLFGVFLFAVGLVAGLFIGIYAFHGGPDRPKCEPVSTNGGHLKPQGMIGAKQNVPKPTTVMPKRDFHDHGHGHGDHGHGHSVHGHGHDDHGHGDHLMPDESIVPIDVGHGDHTFDNGDHIDGDHFVHGHTDDPFHIDDGHGHSNDGHGHSSVDLPIDVGLPDLPSVVPSTTEKTTNPPTTTTPKPTTTEVPTTTEESDFCEVCNWRNPLIPVPEHFIFEPITPDEMRLVREALSLRNITTVKPGDELALNESYIQAMSLHNPVKLDVLNHLDREGPPPDRYGWVSVVEGAAEPPMYMHYKVGPLGEGIENVSVEPILKRGEVTFEKRPYDTVEMKQIILMVMDELFKVNTILQESFDSRTPYQDLTVLPTGPLTDEKGRRTSRFTLGLRGLGDRDFDFLNILPLHGKVYHGARNVSNWYIYDIFYINQGPYENAQALLKDYVLDLVAKIRYPQGTRKATEELTYPKRNMYQPVRENTHFQGTTTAEPNGPRYDVGGNFIRWLGWSFTVATTQHRGPGVYNVKFKNERVVYENSLSDIGLVYSADGSGQDNVVFADATYGLGEARKAIPGVDCPEYAAFLRTTAWDPEAMDASTKLTICVFEKNAQEPLWRHKGTQVEAGLENSYLVVRYPTQIGNYDYILDFEFHLDGRIVTTATATGFIQGSFWNPFNEYFEHDSERTPFGYKVSGTLTGPIHDHTFAYKVDMDVIDEKNDFELIHWKYGDLHDALASKTKNGTLKKFPNYFMYNKTRYITWEHVENETALDVDLINQKFWTVINNNHKNMWNVSRGYRIIPMATGSQNILDDYPRIKELSFTKHHLHITKHHDDETYVKPIYNPDNMDDPDINAKFIDDLVDGESIKNSDIVTWISVGFLHIPTSEDVPMTTRVTTGFTLKPFNFFDSTPTFDVPAHALGENDTVLDNAPKEAPCLYMPMTVRG